MRDKILSELRTRKASNSKSLAVLIDPDKVDREGCRKLVQQAEAYSVDFLFVGGSLISGDGLSVLVDNIKETGCQIPLIIFPGSNMHIDNRVEGLLLLSLISGRNPELLIGQHVVAAPVLKRSGVEILSTGYILMDGGNATTVSYISNTNPIPSDKPDIAACTALAGCMLGHNLIYLDSGSGALIPVTSETVAAVNEQIDVPLIVGGGIRKAEMVRDAYTSGADVVVIGTSIEQNPEFLVEAVNVRNQINELNVHQ